MVRMIKYTLQLNLKIAQAAGAARRAVIRVRMAPFRLGGVRKPFPFTRLCRRFAAFIALLFLMMTSIVCLFFNTGRAQLKLRLPPSLRLGVVYHPESGTGPLIPRPSEDNDNSSSSTSSESIYVITLPHRRDRLAQMEYLRTFLGLKWVYIDATPAIDGSVGRIMGNVMKLRQEAMRGRLELLRVREEKEREKQSALLQASDQAVPPTSGSSSLASSPSTENAHPEVTSGVKLPFEWPPYALTYVQNRSGLSQATTLESQPDIGAHTRVNVSLKSQILNSLAAFDIYSRHIENTHVGTIDSPLARGSGYSYPDFPSFLSNGNAELSSPSAGYDGIRDSELRLVCATKDFSLVPYSQAPKPPSSLSDSSSSSRTILPYHRILTRARVACWHSHLEVIRKIVEEDEERELRRDRRRSSSDGFEHTTISPATTEAGNSTHNHDHNHISIILEDDIDMEKDIRARLGRVWGLLPQPQPLSEEWGWDIVFLGHCWSNESLHPALAMSGKGEGRGGGESIPSPSLIGLNPVDGDQMNEVVVVDDMEPPLSASAGPPDPANPKINPERERNTLHPSHSPRCTHAYALSPSGARKLLHHLTYPPFAYSRAIDQAYAWLVRSGRVRAYSVVPGVIVQRKGEGEGKGSDVWIPDKAGGIEGEDAGREWKPWKEGLVDGVFGGRDI